MIGERYLEVRFEDLVLTPRETAANLLSALGLAHDGALIESFVESIDRGAVGKFRKTPCRKRYEAESVLRPTLEAFGYGLDEGLPRRSWLAWR
jgi:hypothetical protein